MTIFYREFKIIFKKQKFHILYYYFISSRIKQFYILFYFQKQAYEDVIEKLKDEYEISEEDAIKLLDNNDLHILPNCLLIQILDLLYKAGIEKDFIFLNPEVLTCSPCKFLLSLEY